LLLGEEVAKSLGIETKRLRLLALIMTSLIVAVPTSFLGIIGFVGLMSPHIVRLLVGNDYRYVIPYSALVGATILLSADILAKVILAPRTLPVGIVTTLVGAPLFLYLLLKKRTI
ncbi:MAG: iron chelate uptake ABC transporter family permease subunit, partial [Caldimicrobium sp.]|nr:iron ABC transporter permease [Caldimicrobium sp.]MDW8182417.1 iron chelate uptake ABC transporter family permease subunit [Caldimicrobium sp.]